MEKDTAKGVLLRNRLTSFGIRNADYITVDDAAFGF